MSQMASKSSCDHYVRRCAIIAPCCKKKYTCHVCHDESETHTIDRFNIAEICCIMCGTVQQFEKRSGFEVYLVDVMEDTEFLTRQNHSCLINNTCVNCNAVFGKYFCAKCCLFDDNTDKKQFHCDGCGICRIGGRENFFHCVKCDLCLSLSLKNSHKCVEKSSRSNCPVCMDNLHMSRTANEVLQCGHVLHKQCFHDLLKTGNTSCPLCNESMVQLSDVWKQLDEEIANTPMPDEYKNSHLEILCRDCHKLSDVKFHVIGLKCLLCGSYNTSQQGGLISADSSAST